MTYTPYMNFKGSIRSAIADQQRRDLQEMFHAVTLAGNSVTPTSEIIKRHIDGTLGSIYHADAIEAEMLERCHEAISLMDWIEETTEMFPDDYSDWMEETQSLRHGG